jgi:hypothetical protein
VRDLARVDTVLRALIVGFTVVASLSGTAQYQLSLIYETVLTLIKTYTELMVTIVQNTRMAVSSFSFGFVHGFRYFLKCMKLCENFISGGRLTHLVCWDRRLATGEGGCS